MSWLRKLKLEDVLPRILLICAIISQIVWVFIRSDDGHINYSHSSYVALGLMIGFYSSSVVSMLVIWLLKPRRARDSSPVGDTTTGRNSRE